MSIDQVGHDVPLGEAVHLVEGLLLEQASHTFAAVNGWAYPITGEELHLQALLARVVNALRNEKDPPYVPDWPWPDLDRAAAEPAVTDKEAANLKALLDANSAFASIRNST